MLIFFQTKGLSFGVSLKVYLLTPSLSLSTHRHTQTKLKKIAILLNKCGNKKPQLLFVIREAFFSPYVCLLNCVMELIIILSPHMKLNGIISVKYLGQWCNKWLITATRIIFSNNILFFFFGCATCRNLSSPMRDQTQASCFGSTES